MGSSRYLTYIFVLLTSSALVRAEESGGACPADSECAAGSEPKSASLLQKTRATVLAKAGALDTDEKSSEPKVALLAMEQNVAEQRARARVKLGIEADLRKHASKLRSWKDDEDCATNAHKTYEEAIKSADLGAELTGEEKENFEARFTEEMLADCKYDPEIAEHWSDSASEALEHQKPVVTQAFVDSINKANLGYTAELKDWMKNESKLDYDNLLGMDPDLANPQNQSAFLQAEVADNLPDTYDSAAAVPNCADTVRAIHNQGTCGSCWAFGTLSAIDSRLCIASKGAFSGPNAALSRGYTTSCATPGGRNGCNGGWWSFVYNLLGEGINCDRRGGGCKSGGYPGVVTGLDKGCIPYFGHGSGVDHFESKSSAPPCQDQCVKSNPAYFRPFKEDLYVFPGASWASSAVEFAGYTDKRAAQKARQAIYEHGPLPYAIKADSAFKSYSHGIVRGECVSSPNHCVTAIGFGVDYFDSLNSWGPKWGDKGGFKMADCLVTHWSVPADIPAGGFPAIPNSKGGGGAAPKPSPGPPGRNGKPQPIPGPVPPAPAPPPILMKPVWQVTSGPCTVDGTGCMLSPNFKAGGTDEGDPKECEGKTNKYGPNQTCTFQLLTDVSPAIEVVEFVTERGFDIFTVNGVAFSGAGSAVQELQGLVPRGEMTWAADKGFEKTGFRLCPKDPREDMTRVGPFKDSNATPYRVFVARENAGQTSSPWPDFHRAGNFTTRTGKNFNIYVTSSGSFEPVPEPEPAPPAPAPPAPGPPAPAPGPPAPAPPPPTPAPKFNDPDAPEWLLTHNYFRCIHAADPIDWDEDVAAGSMAWAQKGQMSHAKCYKIPAPRGPAGENLAMGYRSILQAVTAWYDENPEKGPSCGGHCTALLWQKSKSLGCGKAGKMYVCRYANSAANYGRRGSYPVGMPDYSKEPECYAKFPVSSRWRNGASTVAAANHKDPEGNIGEPSADVALLMANFTD